MASSTIGIKLDTTLRERLKRLGEQRDRSTHWLMRTAICEYLEREEAHERDRAEDQARWERYEQTGAFVDQSSMTRWLDGLAASARARAQQMAASAGPGPVRKNTKR